MLSVVIPMYNSLQFIEKCITSLISAKNKEKMEIIVVNDGSTDDFFSVLQPLIDANSGIIRLINKENGGHGSCINVGADAAMGKYIKILDADDWFCTEELENILEKLEKINSDIVITNFYRYNIDKSSYHAVNMRLDKYEAEYNMKQISEQWGKVKDCFVFHGLMYNLAFYKQCNCKMTEKVYYEDQEYVTLISAKAKTIYPINETLYVYRVGDVNQSISDVNQLKRFEHALTVLKRLVEYEQQVEEDCIEIWRHKTTSSIYACYITALFREKNRKEQKLKRKKIEAVIKKSAMLYNDGLMKKVRLLSILSIMGVSTKILDKMLVVSSRLRKN